MGNEIKKKYKNVTIKQINGSGEQRERAKTLEWFE